jgi:hypothetical protein
MIENYYIKERYILIKLYYNTTYYLSLLCDYYIKITKKERKKLTL